MPRDSTRSFSFSRPPFRSGTQSNRPRRLFLLHSHGCTSAICGPAFPTPRFFCDSLALPVSQSEPNLPQDLDWSVCLPHQVVFRPRNTDLEKWITSHCQTQGHYPRSRLIRTQPHHRGEVTDADWIYRQLSVQLGRYAENLSDAYANGLPVE